MSNSTGTPRNGRTGIKPRDPFAAVPSITPGVEAKRDKPRDPFAAVPSITPGVEAKRDKPRDPFAAVPSITPGVEAKRDNRSMLQLRLRVEPNSPLMRFLDDKFGYRRNVRLNLDEMGSFFWQQIDGERDLGSIGSKLRKQFRLNRKECELAIIGYTKSLMLRGLVQLRVDEDEHRQNHKES